MAARGADAMAAVENRTCTACYTEITAQNYHELILGQLVVCKSCGRILYLPE
jgi:predicted  nucleic acid-binding Zn-ribbon protein